MWEGGILLVVVLLSLLIRRFVIDVLFRLFDYSTRRTALDALPVTV